MASSAAPLDGSLAVDSSSSALAVVKFPLSKLRQVTNFVLYYASNSSSKNLSVSMKAVSGCLDDRDSAFANASCISKFTTMPMRPLSSAFVALTQSSCSVTSDDSSSFAWPTGSSSRSSALGSPRARGAGRWSCGATRVAVLAGLSDAESTVVSGLVTIATAGTAFGFVVALKDINSNALGSAEPIVARAIIASSWHTANSQQPAIDRNVSLSIDKSGPGVIELGLVSQVGNGVTACATAPSSNVPTCFTQVNLVDVFATNSPPPGYSVTWSGLLSVPESNAYQFYVSSDVVVNFSINGVMYSSPAGSSVEGPPAATVVLQPYAAHAFSFNFTRPQLPQRPVSVMYGSSSQSKQHLPPLALYPSFRRVMPPLSVQVRAGRSCASASTAQLLATIATAGVPLSFQVLMKDEFGNARDVQDDANGDCRTAASCKASAFIHAILSSAPVFIFGSISNQTSSATFAGSVTPASPFRELDQASFLQRAYTVVQACASLTSAITSPSSSSLPLAAAALSRLKRICRVIHRRATTSLQPPPPPTRFQQNLS